MSIRESRATIPGFRSRHSVGQLTSLANLIFFPFLLHPHRVSYSFLLLRDTFMSVEERKIKIRYMTQRRKLADDNASKCQMLIMIHNQYVTALL